MSRSAFKQASSMLALAAALAATPSAQALDFVFQDVGSTRMSTQQLQAFQTAGNYWSGLISDRVTVYLNVSFASLGSGILGGADSAYTTASYSAVRSALAGDARGSNDSTAVATLQGGSALSFLATQGDLTARLDNDGSINNTQLRVTTANAKALGLSTGSPASSPDASIVFSTNFAFDYDRSNGTAAGTYDFLTVAQHEIGHALGFVSGVDDVDYCAGGSSAPVECGVGGGAARFENSAWYSPLDLFRYSAAGALDLRVGGSPYFSLDGGATRLIGFSTGSALHGGDDWQASHFSTEALTLMRPYVDAGVNYDATAADLAALDAMGWDLTSAVPEPASTALLLVGLGAVRVAARRRSAA